MGIGIGIGIGIVGGDLPWLMFLLQRSNLSKKIAESVNRSMMIQDKTETKTRQRQDKTMQGKEGVGVGDPKTSHR